MRRAEAYQNLECYDKALADLHSANAASPFTTDGYLALMGVVNWLAGRENTAIGIWLDLVLATEVRKFQYLDAAGGVQPGCLLWFAAVSLGRPEYLTPARRLFEQLLSRGKTGKCTNIQDWPGPIANFLLGLLDETQLREKANAIPAVAERHLSQAEFYVGVKALEGGDDAIARKHYRKAASLRAGQIEDEYYLAVREGKKRTPRPASPFAERTEKRNP